MDKILSLTPEIKKIIIEHHTEPPNFAREEITHSGTYLCRRCGLAIFRGTNKFVSGCGWPSFDKNLHDAVQTSLDPDSIRTEIHCRRCKAHLGHVFFNENFTALNTRYCVNSLSVDFVNSDTILDSEEAILAGGCFWGVEYYLKRLPGVVKTEVGYTGGILANPSYQQVLQGNTGHYEALRVVYDSRLLSFEEVLRDFFEIHDPTQTEGQGSDIGSQYKSAVFCYDEEQKNIAKKLIKLLENQGFSVATKIYDVSTFWPAELYHQDYYQKNKKLPYCHTKIKRFN